MATKFSTRIYSERTPHQGTSAAQMRNAPRFSIPRYAAYSGKPGRVEIVFEIELPARDPIELVILIGQFRAIAAMASA